MKKLLFGIFIYDLFYLKNMSRGIFYYSTNRTFSKKSTFKEALFLGLAPDSGLFMPSRIPKLSQDEITEMKGKPYSEVAYRVLKKFLRYEIKLKDLRKMTSESYNFKVPIEKLDEFIFLIRLDRGPTASFKDFAARIMARLMNRLLSKNSKITILVATSGDTGGAVGEAYKGIKGIKVYILYPKSEVSSIQKKQLDSIGRNVKALAIDGKFDDCQKLVKQAFSDKELRSLNLTSANSINIGRILPQIVYYFYAYVNCVDSFKKVVFSIPSGNFGSSLGCEIARRMGLPVKKIIIAVNENDEFPRFMKTGKYKKIDPSIPCISNAMNVGNPSNLARYFDLYGGTIDKEGIIHKQPNLKMMKENLYSVSISDKETVKTIKEVYKKYNTVLEPHGAVGFAGLVHYFKNNKKVQSICLETAHPSKFPEILDKLKLKFNIHPSLKRIKQGKADHLTNDYNVLKKYLLKRA